MQDAVDGRAAVRVGSGIVHPHYSLCGEERLARGAAEPELYLLRVLLVDVPGV